MLTAVVSPFLFAGDPIFQIGVPDASPMGFGLSDAGYQSYTQTFPAPIIFAVGKDNTEKFPFIHPGTLDNWAGAKPHTHTINFIAPNQPANPLYLHVGFADTWRFADMTVSVNSTTLDTKKIPTGSGRDTIAYDPLADGKPSTLTFTIPADSIKAGSNTLSIKLDNGSWIVYDYITLSDSITPPALAPRPIFTISDQYLNGPFANIDHIIFAVRQIGSDEHWYANFGYYAHDENRKAYRKSAKLCKLNIRTGKLTTILDDSQGTIRDPQIHYDAKKMIFSYRKSDSDHFNLYEIDTDGSNLRQITTGPHNDIEPTYLPDGSIMFCSSRCNRWVNCWLTQVAVLYRCDADGSNIRQISANNEHENTPWPLPDGRILYQRWEYIDRSQVHYHHLWTTNPDGTNQSIYFGNMTPGIVMIDAKPIPQTDDVLTVFSWGHGAREHIGDIAIVSPKSGPDHQPTSKVISKGSGFRDPYPITKDCFLVASASTLYIMEPSGKRTRVYRLPAEFTDAGLEIHEPRPIVTRQRERTIPSRIAKDKTTGTLILADIYNGRNMTGIKPGSIKSLLVLETLPKPINYTGGMDPLSYGGTFTLERIVGTVPVESDGSAYMELPANRGLFFVALDENGKSVKRMQSFLTVKPGETTSCLGCHEQRTTSGINISKTTLMALDHEPSKVTPIEGVPDRIDFPRDIQPILDEHCVKCHDYQKHGDHGPRSGGVILTGDHGPMFSHSYVNLTVKKQVADGRNRSQSNYPPYALGSSASPLVSKIENNHNEVRLSDRQRRIISLWTDSGAAYPGTYAALGNGSIGGYAENIQNHTDYNWPSTKAAAETMKQRCDSCHTGDSKLPHAMSDENDFSFWMPDLNHPRIKYIRHLMFNLSRPDKSLVLLAPLAIEAGGLGLCNTDGNPAQVFKTTEDPGYQAILTMCSDGKNYLEKIKRFDMPGFTPPQPYIREMKKYGVLPKDLPNDANIDPYETDQAYFRSLWYKPKTAN